MSKDLNIAINATHQLLYLIVALSIISEEDSYKDFNVTKFVMNLYYPDMGVDLNK